MRQDALWTGSETFVLTTLEFYNWGGFQGYHRAEIDTAGTAVIGPTGSGKTTVVDGLMTLLCAAPRYNLASTGGHESDRDLVSYVRGVSGPGDGGPDQSHIARQGQTVTALAATFARDGVLVRLGAVLWFENTSSSASDLKKLWLLSEAPELTLEHWLNQHQGGGMRALRQMENETSGVWAYPGKKHYLARLREYFEVGENAFTLLNRAAGLKQLNSIDDIFRELVLDDRSAFERAAEVVKSFDDLSDIRHELELARKQQRSLQPIAECSQRLALVQDELRTQQALEAIVPVWYAEQAHGLWLAESERLRGEVDSAQAQCSSCDQTLDRQKFEVDQLRQRYLQAGGSGLEHLAQRIEEWTRVCDRRTQQAGQYRKLAARLELSGDLSHGAFSANQLQIQTRLQGLGEQIETARHLAFQAGLDERAIAEQLATSEREHAQVKRRPGSNLDERFHAFRSELAEELGLEDSALPFVAELVQVKAQEQSWRGAIERAIGGHRLRILVPQGKAQAALRWVNQRHNRLHVRLLEVKEPSSTPVFFDDGYTRKLDFKDHPYRQAVKALLADNDRHCVQTPEQLRECAHAMTAQGLMSGKARFFDKQDQKGLDEDWLTGFDNRDRLALLARQIDDLGQRLQPAKAALQTAHDKVRGLEDAAQLYTRMVELQFEDIDLPAAQQQLDALQAQLERLTRPDSELATIKTDWERAEAACKGLEVEYRKLLGQHVSLKTALEGAEAATRRAFQGAEKGLSDALRALAHTHLPTLTASHREDVHELERQQLRALRETVALLSSRQSNLQMELATLMSDAKKLDTGALSEAGRELADIPRYLERLRVLTEEALPDKLKRFLEYLNRSSDDGVTQLLSYIEHEVGVIEERLEELNATMRRVDFQPGHYLRLVANKVIHERLRTLQRAQRHLNSARFIEDAGESHYQALQQLIALLKDACEHSRNLGPKALLDPRFRLEFAVSVVDRETGDVLQTCTGSQGGSGGEKEIIASFVLTASLSYALCPDGSSRPLFGTIVLDEAFSRSSHAVAGRIIAALHEFGLHAVFITPNKEMRLLRHHTRSAVLVHRRGVQSSLISLSWEALDAHHQQRQRAVHEVAD